MWHKTSPPKWEGPRTTGALLQRECEWAVVAGFAVLGYWNWNDNCSMLSQIRSRIPLHSIHVQLPTIYYRILTWCKQLRWLFPASVPWVGEAMWGLSTSFLLKAGKSSLLSSWHWGDGGTSYCLRLISVLTGLDYKCDRPHYVEL